MSVTWHYLSPEGVSFCLYVNLTLVTPNSFSWVLILLAFFGGGGQGGSYWNFCSGSLSTPKSVFLAPVLHLLV